MTVGELISEAIREVTTLNGPPAVVATLIFSGYALKMIQAFPNRFIPMVNAMIAPVLTLVLVGWPTPDTMAPGLRWPELAAWLTALVQSLLLLCMSWVLHDRILRKVIDDKVAAWNPGRETSEVKQEVSTSTPTGTETVSTVTQQTTDKS